jgi:mRNA-degrading endonuclease RelE of RelBE toxin-antitoxin system
MATVILTVDAKKQFAGLPQAVRERVAKILARLEKWPNVSGVKRLTGSLAGCFRIRTGDYRMRFRISGELITVDKIGHRKDVYED